MKYAISRYLWNAIPTGIRKNVYRRYGSAIEKIKNKVFSHDELYNDDYYKYVEKEALKSANVIAETITDQITPQSVIDIGCGTGALISLLRERYGTRVVGLEYSEAALQYCRRRKLDVIKFDIESDSDPMPNDVFDLVISMEVAEHLPERCADRYVHLLCSKGPRVLFTAAIPGQGGQDHVNEQPNAYWIEKFGRNDFTLNISVSSGLKQIWRENKVSYWYYQNLMVFERHPQ